MRQNDYFLLFCCLPKAKGCSSNYPGQRVCSQTTVVIWRIDEGATRASHLQYSNTLERGQHNRSEDDRQILGTGPKPFFWAFFYNRRSLFSVQSLKTADLALTIVHAFFDKLQLHCLIEISFQEWKKRLDTLHFYVGNITSQFLWFLSCQIVYN